jgi:hypothetical protein
MTINIMKQKIKYLPLLFLFVFCVALFGQISLTSAQIDFTPQVIHQIDFQGGAKETKIYPSSIGNLIKAIYNYALGIVGILATLVMMYGGVLYITAAGNASKMDNAKQWIFSSLTGLVLALSSYTLLYIVNPNLLTMTSIDPVKPKTPPAECTTNDDCKGGTNNILACITPPGVCSDLKEGSRCSNTCLEGDCYGGICMVINSASMPASAFNIPISSCANKPNGTRCDTGSVNGCCLTYNCVPPSAYNNTGDTCNMQ